MPAAATASSATSGSPAGGGNASEVPGCVLRESLDLKPWV